MSTAALGWSLIHSLWQGAAVALALAVVLAGVGRRASSLRYLLSIAALALLVLLPVGTCLRIAVTTPGPAPLPSGAEIAGDGPGTRTTGSSAPGAVGAATGRWAEAVAPALPWLVAAWLAGVLTFSLRLAGGWLWVRRLPTAAARPAPPAARDALERLARSMGLRRAVRLVESARVSSPLVVGWLRPVVVVPPAALLGLDPAHLEAVLAHELAHVRRHDYPVNLLQSLAEVLLFYHPAAWWVSRQVRIEREHCCDDAGAAACGDPVVYARALVRLEELRRPAPLLALAAAGPGGGGRGSLLGRVRRLLEPAQPPASALALAPFAVVLALLAVAGSAAGIGAAPAEPGRDQAPAPAAVGAADGSERSLARFTAQERVLLARYSVGEAYVRELAEVGLSGLSAAELVMLRRYGVEGGWIAAVGELGYRDLSVLQWTTLRRYSVEPEWVARLREEGYGGLDVETLVALRRYGAVEVRP